jgi:hypothetical protein
MSYYLPTAKNILFQSAASDIMSDKRIVPVSVGYDSYMGKVAGQTPRDNVAYPDIRVFHRKREGFSGALKILYDIWNPPMINAIVRFRRAPNPGIACKRACHILMNKLLKIKPHPSKGAHHHIAANTALHGDIPHRIIKFNVLRSVIDRDPDKGFGAFGNIRPASSDSARQKEN